MSRSPWHLRPLRGLFALPAALVIALAIAAGAAAQVSAPALPAAPAVPTAPAIPGGIGDRAGDAVQQPLPGPVEDVVTDSPVGPVRDGVRDTVDGAVRGGTGGGGGGSNGGGSTTRPAAPGSGSSGTGTRSGGSSGGQAGPAGANGDRGSRSRAAKRRAAARRARARARARARRARANRAKDAGSAASGGASSRSAEGGVGGRLRDIVEVVPGWVKLALAALVLMVLAFAARMFAERRRARRIDADRERLQRNVGVLQGALLPEAPERIGTLEASVSYRPAEGLAAGGDFYDLFELADGRVAVMVGDVSGHGQEALMQTASVRHSVGAYLRAGADPRGALAAAGELLPMGDDASFTTILLAVYDPEAGTFTYASAGHPPPLFTGAAAHEPISCSASPPVGAGSPTGLRQTIVSLPPGAAACLFTDGLIEARCGEGRLGRERLAEMVEDLPDEKPAAELIERVSAVADTAGDDLAVCMVRATAGPKRPRARIEELEVGPGEQDLARAERLLEACGLPEAEVQGARDELVMASPALLRVIFAKQPRAEVRPLNESAAALLPA